MRMQSKISEIVNFVPLWLTVLVVVFSVAGVLEMLTGIESGTWLECICLSHCSYEVTKTILGDKNGKR